MTAIDRPICALDFCLFFAICKYLNMMEVVQYVPRRIRLGVDFRLTLRTNARHDIVNVVCGDDVSGWLGRD